MYTRIWWGNLNEGGRLDDIRLEGSIKRKMILKAQEEGGERGLD